MVENEIYKVEISFEYVIFDHRSKWGNFCDLLGFNEFKSILKCKIVFKA